MSDSRPASPLMLLNRFKERGGRGDRTAFGTWFWEIDRVLLLLALILIAIGLIAVASASPSAAQRLSGEHYHMPPLHFLWWQLAWAGVSLPFLFGVSMMSKDAARRMAVIGSMICVVLLMAVLAFGVTKNGATRWLDLGVGLLQPSEFLKPFFIVTVAWLLSLRTKEPDFPAVIITGLMTAGIAFLLMMQPDFGQTVIFCLCWMALLMIAGTPMRALAAIVGAAPVGVVAAYLFYDTARTRINAFLPWAHDTGDKPDTFQTDAAHTTISAGGWFGTGPGGGHAKFGLPEGHTDYIFSVIGEEFGLVACAVIALIFLAIVVRVFVRLLDEQDEFRLYAAAGLATQFGTQALVSMAVNTGLAPSKGMTLPFISYGGSSMVALSIGMGLLLSFTRANPFVKRSPYVIKWSGE